MLILRSRCLLSSAKSLLLGLLLIIGLPASISAESKSYDSGLFWSIEKEGEVVGHILGTHHSNDPRVTALAPNVKRILLAANSFSIESFPGARYFNPHWGFRNILRDMTLPEDQMLKDVIGDELYKKVEKILLAEGVKKERFEKLYPWSVMNELGTYRLASNEKRGPIMDHMMYEMVAGKVEDLYQVETLEELVAAYYDFPMAAQVALLSDRVEFHGKLRQVSQAMLKAYLDEDLEKMLRLSIQFISADSIKKGYDKVYLKNVLFERNYVMAHHMLAPLRRKGAFIAVGALHLYGETGVIGLLENQYGYSLKRLKLGN